MIDGEIQLVINTTEGRSYRDSFSLRRTALPIASVLYDGRGAGLRWPHRSSARALLKLLRAILPQRVILASALGQPSAPKGRLAKEWMVAMMDRFDDGGWFQRLQDD